MAEVQPGNQFRTFAPGNRHPGDDRGGAITSYLSLRSDIQQVRADLTVKVSEHELRLAAIERGAEDQIKQQREFQTEMRASITRIFELLTDLRVQFGRRHG